MASALFRVGHLREVKYPQPLIKSRITDLVHRDRTLSVNTLILIHVSTPTLSLITFSHVNRIFQLSCCNHVIEMSFLTSISKSSDYQVCFIQMR